MGLRPASALGKPQPPICLAGPGEWPAVRSGGRAVDPEGEGQQSHGEVDAAGRTREPTAIAVGSARCASAIDVGATVPPERQVESVSERFSPWSGADPCADLSADPVANPSATYRSQRSGFAAMPLGKRHCGAFGASGCEPQCEVQCELQNEVQCEARAKRSKRFWNAGLSLLTFCPTTQMGRRRWNGPPPAHEV